ncbi:hypothetical protein ColKHC_11637 [Colletotrichum higginsianum]|nr:hypothetical protein ColKHC_11637 [Colletotrichum higginsianum]
MAGHRNVTEAPLVAEATRRRAVARRIFHHPSSTVVGLTSGRMTLKRRIPRRSGGVGSKLENVKRWKRENREREKEHVRETVREIVAEIEIAGATGSETETENAL